MEKTYVKNFKIVNSRIGLYEASFEMSDEVRGFFMPVHLEAETEDKALKKANKFLGREVIFIKDE